MTNDARWPTAVTIRTGALQGSEDRLDTISWKAIPFAQPPVGELRWKAPRDPKPWEGVRDATAFAAAPWLAGGRDVSEDCLYLNVWRPAHDRTGLPVYVWLPGGGNQTQMPLLSQTPGSFVASRSDVVVVTVPYRLNNLGWFRHPALRTGDAYDDSGNYGTLDIIQALRWIQSNIEAFGGDPGNVFVTGESAGAYNTLTLLISPAARGLYHKSMAQSGRQDHTVVEAGDDRGERVLANLLTHEHGGEEAGAKALASMSAGDITAFLRSRTPEQLAAAARRVPFLAGYRDGEVLHTKGFDALDDGSYPNKVDAIVGMNEEEAKFQLQRNRELLEDRELYEAVAKQASDRKRATGCDSVLRRLRGNADQPPVYGYLFRWGWGGGDHASPLPEPASWQYGAAHGADIAFFLHGARGERGSFTPENEPGRIALADAMAGYVRNFAHTGVPAAPSPELPAWEPWSNEPGGPKLIEFDATHTELRVRMGREELTVADVDARTAALPDPLRERMAATTGRRR